MSAPATHPCTVTHTVRLVCSDRQAAIAQGYQHALQHGRTRLYCVLLDLPVRERNAWTESMLGGMNAALAGRDCPEVDHD